MKKAVQYILVGVFAVLLGAGLTYMRLSKSVAPRQDKPSNPVEPEEPKTLDDEIFYRDANREENKITQAYDICINGFHKRLEVVFTLDEAVNDFVITGVVRGVEVFRYVQDKKTVSMDEFFTVDFVNGKFKDNKIEFIRGLDNKNYLAIKSYDSATNRRGYYVFNQEFDCLNAENMIVILDDTVKIFLEGGASIWYKDTDKSCVEGSSCQIKSKIEKNKIYSLLPSKSAPASSFDILEEYIYMVDNNRLVRELVSTYKISEYVTDVK